jgi:bacillithiol biosynthesis deacetylase BshB1
MESENLDLKLDLLVITVHPDDAELGCAGTILKHIAAGKKVGIVDLTQGELGTRGTAETRHEEAADAARLLGVNIRENLKMRDGFFRNDEEHQLKVINTIRKYKPEIIISNALRDRHPDHGRAGDLINDAVFLAGLRKITTYDGDVEQSIHRPRLLLQLIQDYYIQPDIVVDISDYWEQKIKVIQAYKTQFFNPEYKENEPQTYISRPEFLDVIESRAIEFGKNIQTRYAEGFTCRRLLGVNNLFDLL